MKKPGYSSVPGFLADTGGAVFNLAVFFWRLTVFHFLAVSSFAVPGTGKFAGIIFGGLKYGGFVPAVPGTAKFKILCYFLTYYSSLLVGTNIICW